MKHIIFENSYLISNHNDDVFEKIAIDLFHFQYLNNEVYKKWCDLIEIEPHKVQNIEQIPFLPISSFKSHKVLPTGLNPKLSFQSSGTSSNESSFHYIAYPELYKHTLMKNFEFFYGKPDDYTFLALLPSYLEKGNSSLVYMCKTLMDSSNDSQNGFYLYEHEKLYKTICELKNANKKTILIGVSYALLDFAEKYNFSFPNLIVMETGGMKGRRKEIIREDLHSCLKTAFGVENIHSEYGMTELLSQAYSKQNGKFYCPPWMKIFVRKSTNPFELEKNYRSGGINVIDLANAYSCPFIATEDLGKKFDDNSFEVLGRFDYAAVRGCNTMINN